MAEQLTTYASHFFEWGFLSADLTFALCAVTLLGHFDRHPRTVLARLLDVVAILAADFAVNCALYLVTGVQRSSMAVFAVLLACYALLQKDVRTTDKVVRWATLMASFVLLIGIVGVLAVALGLSYDNPLRWLLPNIGSCVALFAVSLFLRRFSVSRFRYIPGRYANLVVVVCVIAAVTGLYLMAKGLPDEAMMTGLTTAEMDARMLPAARVNLLVDLGLLALVLISYRMFYLLSVEHEQRAERLVTKRTASDNAEMIEVTKSVYEQMREVRHETKNHVAYMRTLLEEGQYDRLREYFSAFTEHASALTSYVQSGNATVDAVVNAKIALASSQGVSVKTMLAVPEQLGFAEEDLYAIIANLMDNAIEGAVASEAEDKVVKLSIRPEGGYYFIVVQNPCSHRSDARGSLSRLKTTKADKEVHGYGTKVISRIARRGNGTARYEVADDVFTVTVMLAQEVA